MSSDIADGRADRALAQHCDSILSAVLNKGQQVVIVLPSWFKDKGIVLINHFMSCPRTCVE